MPVACPTRPHLRGVVKTKNVFRYCQMSPEKQKHPWLWSTKEIFHKCGITRVAHALQTGKNPTVNREPPGGLICLGIIKDLLQWWRAIITQGLLVPVHKYQLVNFRITDWHGNDEMRVLKNCSSTHIPLWMLVAGIRTREETRNKSFQEPTDQSRQCSHWRMELPGQHWWESLVYWKGNPNPSEPAFTPVTFRQDLLSDDFPEGNSKAKRKPRNWTTIQTFPFSIPLYRFP